MAEEETKTKVETEETSNTFGGFNNKYVKGAIAAVIAAYAAKKDPYLLKGFQEKVDELEKADRERRNKFIESATSAATTEIARNKLRRLQRREKIAPEIKRAVENGMNPIIAGKAYKSGHLPTLMKLKLKNANLNLNTFYNVADQYKDTISGFSETDVIEALAGPTLKLDNTFNNLKAPRRLSPISNLLSDSTDTSAQDEIQQNIDAQTPSSDDYKSIDYSGIEVSDLGTRALASMQKVRNITANQIKSYFTRNLSNVLGIKSGISSNGEYVFASDDKINEGYGMKIQSIMSKEVEDLITKEFMSPSDAQTQVFNKYFKSTKDGLKINMGVVGPEGLKILPKGWTPAKSKGGNTGSKTGGGTGGGKTTLSSLKSNWIKKKADLLKQFGNNKYNKKYQAQIKTQGDAVRKQYKVLGGNESDIDLTY